jgi:MFS family permease
MIVASLAVGRASTVPQLLIWRSIQGLGAAPNIPLGAAVIGDIYRLEERGTALGAYFGVSIDRLDLHFIVEHAYLQSTFLGLALAPTIGGTFFYPRTLHFIHDCQVLLPSMDLGV